MESVKAIQNFIGPVLEKYQIDLSLPFLMVRFEDTVGNQIAIFRFDDDYLYIDEAFGEDDRCDAIKISLCIRGDDWIPTSYGKGRYHLSGVNFLGDEFEVEEVNPRKMKKVAKKCEAWVNKIVKGNGCSDCLIPTMVQYQENKQWVRNFYAVCR